MVSRQYKVRPQIDAGKAAVAIGAGDPKGDAVWIGSLAEETSGRVPEIWMSTSKEQVVAIVGKRGSGKSFTLGVIAEGLSARGIEMLARQESPRAILLFDPLDVYWTTRFGVAPTDNDEVQRHYQMAKTAGLLDLSFDVHAWIPGQQNRRDADPEWFRTLHLPVSALALEEWEILLDVNLMTQPIGQALTDALVLVREEGFTSRNEPVAPAARFSLKQLADAVRSDELSNVYHQETLRALAQRLGALQGTGLFSETGTSITELLEPGRVSVVMLGRLPDGYRSAVVAVLTRMLISARSETSFAEKRLALDSGLTEEEKSRLQATVDDGIARTVVMLDEAQSFLSPGAKSSAKSLFTKLVKEGRNIGLSAILATQQPSAIDQRILSQVETFVAHQLVTSADIKAVRENLKSNLPDSIQFGSNKLDFSGLLRQLSPGLCVVSAADMSTTIRRAMVVGVRPRATVHGGIEL